MKDVTKKKNVHEGHRNRLTEELFADNFLNSSEHRILEFMLFHCNAQKDTNPLAHALIDRFGSLNNVLSANIKDLQKVKGVGKVTAHFLASYMPIMHRLNIEKSKVHIKADNTDEMVRSFGDLIRFNNREKFLLIALNDKYQSIASLILDNNSFDDEIRVSFQDCYNFLSTNKSSKLVIMHNHPSSSVNPSEIDIKNTKSLVSYLDKLGAKLIEHIVLTENEYFSFRTKGFMDEFYRELGSKKENN